MKDMVRIFMAGLILVGFMFGGFILASTHPMVFTIILLILFIVLVGNIVMYIWNAYKESNYKSFWKFMDED